MADLMIGATNLTKVYNGKTVVNTKLMTNAMQYAADFDLVCLCHCEDKSLVEGGVVNEGKNATLAGLKGSIRAAEDIIIAREICLAESLDLPVHICHVSTYSGVQLIREAKKRGVKVTAETCPHYFTLTDESILTFDTNTKVNPPLREERDRLAIIEGLKDGTLDCIVTDHAPHHEDDKRVEYDARKGRRAFLARAYKKDEREPRENFIASGRRTQRGRPRRSHACRPRRGVDGEPRGVCFQGEEHAVCGAQSIRQSEKDDCERNRKIRRKIRGEQYDNRSAD